MLKLQPLPAHLSQKRSSVPLRSCTSTGWSSSALLSEQHKSRLADQEPAGIPVAGKTETVPSVVTELTSKVPSAVSFDDQRIQILPSLVCLTCGIRSVIWLPLTMMFEAWGSGKSADQVVPLKYL